MSLLSSLGNLLGVGTTTPRNITNTEDEDKRSRRIMLECAAFLEKAPQNWVRIESELPYPKAVIVKVFVKEIKFAQMVFQGAAMKHKARTKEDLEIVKQVFLHLLHFQPIDEVDCEIVQRINKEVPTNPEHVAAVARVNPNITDLLKVALQYTLKYFARAKDEATGIFKNYSEDPDLRFLTKGYDQIIESTRESIRQLENSQ